MITENIIRKASDKLKKHNINTHELDAQIIFSHIIGVSKESIILNKNFKISKEMFKKFNSAIKRRAKKEPVAYILRKKEFWSEDFTVNGSTLIPRPETELLIYKLINHFKNKNISILDIGTGSGCILLSILKELSLARGLGIDISRKAVKTAVLNSKKLKLTNRSKFKVFDINKFNFGKYDLIVSNPPYIPSKDIKNLSDDITKYEPLIALNGGLDGLDLIKKVIYKSISLLKKDGLLAIEIGNKQYKKVSNLLGKHGFREIEKIFDFRNNVRCIIRAKI